MLEEFINHKTNILDIIADTQNLLKENIGKGDERLFTVREQLISNHFNLVILGQFKRGKTTLINSLVGSEILPSSVVPLTSIVTILKYGEKIRCSVFMHDGHEKTISIDKLHDYVTESGNPKNTRGVKCAIIEHPFQLLEKGMQLVDTPGVGSTFLHNTETTYEFLDQLDAAVFLMSADIPISQAEKELLETIKDSTQKIFFVLNKIDNLSPDEIMEISAYNKQVLRDMGFDVQDIWPVSARKALGAKIAKEESLLLQSGLPNLEDALGRFLSSEKGRIVLGSSLLRVKDIIFQRLSQIEIEKKTLLASEEDLENKIKSFHALEGNLKRDREDIAYLLQGETIKLNKKVEEMLKVFEESEVTGIRQCLQDYYDNNQGINPTTLRDKMQHLIKEEIVKGFDRFREGAKKIVSGTIQETFNRFTKRSDDIMREFKTAAGNLFEVSMHQFELSIELAEDIYFYYMVQDGTSVTEEEVKSVLRTFLPKSLSRKMVLKEMVNLVPSEVARNCGRTRSSLATSIGNTIGRYSRKIGSLGDDLIEQIEQAVQKGSNIRNDSAESVQNELTKLSGMSEMLEEKAAKLDDLWDKMTQKQVVK